MYVANVSYYFWRTNVSGQKNAITCKQSHFPIGDLYQMDSSIKFLLFAVFFEADIFLKFINSSRIQLWNKIQTHANLYPLNKVFCIYSVDTQNELINTMSYVHSFSQSNNLNKFNRKKGVCSKDCIFDVNVTFIGFIF